LSRIKFSRRSETVEVSKGLWKNGENFQEGIRFLRMGGVLIGSEGEKNRNQKHRQMFERRLLHSDVEPGDGNGISEDEDQVGARFSVVDGKESRKGGRY
jgi:hypothetical protein